MAARKRAPKSKKHDRPPTPPEMAAAARRLHWGLGQLVAHLDKGQAEGMDDGLTWEGIWWGRKWTDAEIEAYRARGGKVWYAHTQGAPTPGRGLPDIPVLQLAILEAARREVDGWRPLTGYQLGKLALQVAMGQVTPARAAEAASEIRRDGLLPTEAAGLLLDVMVGRKRSQESKWATAYRILAQDADVEPRPDKRSGLRGPLRALYRTLLRDKHRFG